MINEVLDRLDTLQAHLAAIDPTREIDAADKVAAIAAALRDTVARATDGRMTEAPRWTGAWHAEPRRLAG